MAAALFVEKPRDVRRKTSRGLRAITGLDHSSACILSAGLSICLKQSDVVSKK